ncbi:MAG: hemolysin XhlA family protein [Carnobacterium sp.]|uniref:hemolysin XhlA family protein n=1 Tax=Carnobacterium sp. TaxID=48221 RepID=UPI003C73F9E5
MQDSNFEREMIDRLARIEVKVDDISATRETAELADRKSDEAISRSRENEKDIAEIKANTKWIWGFIITFGIGIFMFFLNSM